MNAQYFHVELNRWGYFSYYSWRFEFVFLFFLHCKMDPERCFENRLFGFRYELCCCYFFVVFIYSFVHSLKFFRFERVCRVFIQSMCFWLTITIPCRMLYNLAHVRAIVHVIVVYDRMDAMANTNIWFDIAATSSSARHRSSLTITVCTAHLRLLSNGYIRYASYRVGFAYVNRIYIAIVTFTSMGYIASKAKQRVNKKSTHSPFERCWPLLHSTCTATSCLSSIVPYDFIALWNVSAEAAPSFDTKTPIQLLYCFLHWISLKRSTCHHFSARFCREIRIIFFSKTPEFILDTFSWKIFGATCILWDCLAVNLSFVFVDALIICQILPMADNVQLIFSNLNSVLCQGFFFFFFFFLMNHWIMSTWYVNEFVC